MGVDYDKDKSLLGNNIFKYQKRITMADAVNGKALEIRVMQFHDDDYPNLKEKFAFYFFESSDPTSKYWDL